MLEKDNNHSATVLVVDDEESVCIALREILKCEFTVLVANSGRAALGLMQPDSDTKESRIDLVLTDISMTKMDGIELLKRIKEQNSKVEVIMITGHPTSETTLAALKLGASDYIIKPFQAPEVLQSVYRVIERRREFVKVEKMIEDLKGAIQKNYSATTDALMLTIDAKDHYTKEHCARVAAYIILLAQRIGLDSHQQQLLKKVALLHDIGKIGVREEVLNKPGRLTKEEWEEIKHHSFIGYQIIQPVEFLGAAREILLYHQERFDGKGYPGGLKGKEIPQGARMMAIVDSYDAMVTDRPYRKALTKSEALTELKKGNGTQFDPELVKIFVEMMKEKEGV